MLLRRLILPLSAALLVSAAFAAPPADDQHCRPAGFQMFSPEQRLMMLADAKKATADGSLDMQDYRAMQRDKIKAMSPDQRAAYFADLTKRFNALPASEKASLKAEGEKLRKEREARGGAMGGRAHGDHPMGDHPCPPPKG